MMKYFLVRMDPQFDTAPEIIDWFKRIDRRDIRHGESYKIENRQLFFIKGRPQTTFPDILSFPYFMVTEIIRNVIRMYEPHTIFKEIVLLDQENSDTCTYYIPVLEYVDCLSIYSKLTKDRSTILEGVLNKGKVSDCSIFYLEGVGNLYTVVRMDLVESILRRGAKGLELNEVKLADE